MREIIVETSRREEMVDITRAAREVVKTSGWQDGALLLFCRHTTCGLTINEGADPAVRADLIRFFRGVAPKINGWSHAEGNTDAHIRASLLGASLLVPVEKGELTLGTWQAIYLYEGDGPRRRSIFAQFLDIK